ncbi:unnamed protein product [Candida verbasci]|uniref:U three protein 23 n=1 Tax=Candida verbasci TaxID=1227364 RepID=A0A9W4TR91_9ASCO|nr:unnamed protein product [Candida verbasci]
MRQKRAKAYKKQMNVYLYTFKFREPFQTIIDDEIILTCESASYDILKGLQRTIQSQEMKPMITQCCIESLYKTKNQKAIDIAKTFERRKCNHREPVPPIECLKSIIDINGENKHRYIVASQDLKLRQMMRKIPGVPLIYMNRSVMVMEPLSDASSEFTEKVEKDKLIAGLNDTGKEIEEQSQVKKRKGPKEPNPLKK